MKVLSVNVAMPLEIEFRGRPVKTSIFKKPVKGRVIVRRLNIDGDAQSDLIGHGGEHRAVMVYQAEAYQYWREQLNRDDLFYGQFGENLTVEGLADKDVCIGDRYAIGTAIFEVTQPRVTCYRVGISLEVPGMPALLVKHKRPGFYFRVIDEGDIAAGDEIIKLKDGEERMSVAEIDGLLYLNDHPKEKLQKALRIPALSQSWKGSFRNLLDAVRKGVTKGNAGLSGPGETIAWTGFRPFVVQKSSMECEGIRSFELNAWDGGLVPSFLPGQHIAVRVHPAEDGVPVIRMYSLCGSQGASGLRIAVKKEANGAGSIYMHEQVRTGDILGISAPRGSFILSEGTEPVVLLSAGVGVTPLLSMLYQLAALEPGREVWWIHSCRNKKYEAFGEEVRLLAIKLTSFHRVIVYSSPGDGERRGIDYDLDGHLDLQQLKALSLPTESGCYVCGPPAYIHSITAALKELGMSIDKIKSELFGSAPEPINGRIPHLPSENTGEGPLVTFNKSKLSFRWHSRFGSLLEAAESCDVQVQWSCRMGVCHRCETAMIDGEVTYSPEPLQSPAEGNVLICCSVPGGNVVLDL